MTYTFTFPYLPSGILSPNGRAFWRAKAKAAKLLRTDAYLYAKQQGLGGLMLTGVRAVVQVRSTKPGIRRDLDNYMGRFKALWDGMVDAGVMVGDHAAVFRPEWAAVPFVNGDDDVVILLEVAG